MCSLSVIQENTEIELQLNVLVLSDLTFVTFVRSDIQYNPFEVINVFFNGYYSVEKYTLLTSATSQLSATVQSFPGRG